MLYHLARSVQIQQTTNWWYILLFPQKTGFDISSKLSRRNKKMEKKTDIF